MKRGQTLGSYFLFSLQEGLFRLRKELIGWRGVAVLLIVALMLLDAAELAKEGEYTLLYQGVGALWLSILFPPRMGRLLHLLPFSKKERIRYLAMYSVTYLSFQVLLYAMVGGIVYLISGYSYLLWIRSFALCTFPFIMLYSGIMIDSMANSVRNSYPANGMFFSTRNLWLQETDAVAGIKEDCKGTAQTTKQAERTEEEREKAKKQTIFTIKTVLVTIIPALLCCGGWMFSELYVKFPWTIYAGSALAYVSAIAGLLIYWGRISEELNSVGNAGKEESGCNL